MLSALSVALLSFVSASYNHDRIMNPTLPPITRISLDILLRERLQLSQIRPFQLDCGLLVNNRTDVFLVAGPGLGKTVVLLAPLLVHQDVKKAAVALCIVPSKILAEQQVWS